MSTRHKVRVSSSEANLPRQAQLAWKLAELAADETPLDHEVIEMIGNRLIDNAAVALAALNRAPVIAARDQALAHSLVRSATPGATLFGLDAATTTSPEWAAWANGVAVRELDFHDTFLAADYSHPGDNIPPILAVAQHLGKSGHEVARAIATGYEVQISLTRAVCLHKHKIDHVAHLGPSAAAALGTLLNLDIATTAEAIAQALHLSTATRQSRKGEISSWKAYAPAHAGKIAVEAVDRAMRGQTSPNPIYEGEDGVIAWMLDGPDAEYEIALPARDEPRRAILDSYTKEHSAEYQAQAWIDLARRVHRERPDWTRPGAIQDITLRTSHHTHFVIGSGANDPQKYDPHASRETLDHSLPYIFAVALQDGGWHHVDSYAPSRAQRADTVELWRKIRTEEDPIWTAKYHDPDPDQRAFGGTAVFTLANGEQIVESIDVADAHPRGARPFAREQYREKLHTLAHGIASEAELAAFVDRVERLDTLDATEVRRLNPRAEVALEAGSAASIF